MTRRWETLSVMLMVVCGGVAPVSVRGADEAVSLVTRQLADGGLFGWQFYCEEQDVTCGDVWQLRDDVLICRGTPKGYVYTTRKYEDFVLRLEWRWPADKQPGNGGVLVRMTGPHKIWPRSLEAQINAGQAGDFWGLDGFSLQGPAGRSEQLEHEQFGKLYHVTKLANLEKPAGEWNEYEIVARGPVVTLKINGQVVNEATRCDAVAGPICLTAEGDEIHFRRVELIAP
jgi:hypothetical protein